jgi:CRP-like cAMP-binding protein
MTSKLDLCHEYPLFSELSAEQMQSVRELCLEECFYPGYTLFQDGDPATKMYVLVDGEIELSLGKSSVARHWYHLTSTPPLHAQKPESKCWK